MHVLRFTVEETRYALAIERVVEVAPRVLMTPLAGTPSFVEGVFSFRQSACVGVSLRRRFGHPDRPIAIDEHIVIVKGRTRLLGLIVDRADGDEVITAGAIEAPADGARHIAGVVALDDGVLLIHDVDALLTDDEERAVDRGLVDTSS